MSPVSAKWPDMVWYMSTVTCLVVADHQLELSTIDSYNIYYTSGLNDNAAICTHLITVVVTGAINHIDHSILYNIKQVCVQVNAWVAELCTLKVPHNE